MARKFLTSVDLAKNELQNAAVQNLASAPSSPVKGQIYMNSTDNTLYWWDGAQWVAAKAAAGATPAATVTTQAVGDAPVVGVSTNFAREDHKHGREAFGAVTAQTAFGAASANGSAATVTRSDHTHGTPVHDNAAHSAITLNSLAAPTADVAMGGRKITNLADPVATSDAATRNYVSNVVNSVLNGLSWKRAVDAATTTNITLTGSQTIDGVAVLQGISGVLVKNQTTASENGIYDVQSGAWNRRADMDVNTEFPSATVMVMGGTVNADTSWTCNVDLTFVLGQVNNWVQVSGPGTITAGAGLTQTANAFNVIAGDTSLTVAADSVIVNTAVIATVASLASYTRKFTQATIGGATSQVVTHNLGTQAVVVGVFRTLTPWEVVECDVEMTTVNTVTLRFATAPATNEFTCVVIG